MGSTPASPGGGRIRRAFARTWAAKDPSPTVRANRIVAAHAASTDLEYELLVLATRNGQRLMGARGPNDVFTMTFESGELCMVVRVSPAGEDSCRIDGWVSPPTELSVRVVQGDRSWDTEVSEQGRFEFPAVRSGPARFLLHPTGPGNPAGNKITPAVDL
ncbi:MAG: hypothetical protein ACRCYQ_05020 [Nocardioides sp.]